MEALRESFVFHFDYIEDVPQELQAQYAMYAINYARYGTEPELTDWRDVKMWNKTKERMNGEFDKYEKKCSNLKNHKNKKVDNRIDTESSSNRERLDTEGTASSAENGKSSGDTVSVSVYESDTVPENDYEAPAASMAAARKSPSQVQYSKILFDIFQEAGLPCANGNQVTFLMRDFSNAMTYLHKMPGLDQIHSDDLIQACKNYAQVINSGQSFMTGRYSLDRFVTFKNFTDFLPGNFYPENFQKKQEQRLDKYGKPVNTPPAIERKTWYEKCPGCGQQLLAWQNEAQKYTCCGCGKTYGYEEVHK